VLSFLNTSKYPPSLLFLLMTLGPAMLFLWAVDARTPQWLRPALVFGEVPMFYYPLHIPLIHLPAVIVGYARYGQVHWMFESLTVGQFPITPPPDGDSLCRLSIWSGLSLWSCSIRRAVGLHP
jgi:hypothetical protein